MFSAFPGPNLHGLTQRDFVAFVVQLELGGVADVVKDFEVAGLGGRQPEAVPPVTAPSRWPGMQ